MLFEYEEEKVKGNSWEESAEKIIANIQKSDSMRYLRGIKNTFEKRYKEALDNDIYFELKSNAHKTLISATLSDGEKIGYMEINGHCELSEELQSQYMNGLITMCVKVLLAVDERIKNVEEIENKKFRSYVIKYTVIVCVIVGIIILLSILGGHYNG